MDQESWLHLHKLDEVLPVLEAYQICLTLSDKHMHTTHYNILELGLLYVQNQQTIVYIYRHAGVHTQLN
jgi:hypothetical protein